VPDRGLDAAEKLLRQFGVARALVASSSAILGDLASGNSVVVDEVAKTEFFRAYLVLNLLSPDESQELAQKTLSREDFSAVLLSPGRHDPPLNSEAPQLLVKTLLRFDKPVYVRLRDRQDMDDLASLGGKFPGQQFVAGDIEASAWMDACRTARKHTNMTLDCGGACAIRDKIKLAVDYVGTNRLILGSSYPLCHPIYAIGMVRDADVPAWAKERILQENARRIFKL
jgi:predicted TIM-barrel fold metal-dependent hydrolase